MNLSIQSSGKDGNYRIEFELQNSATSVSTDLSGYIVHLKYNSENVNIYNNRAKTIPVDNRERLSSILGHVSEEVTSLTAGKNTANGTLFVEAEDASEEVEVELKHTDGESLDTTVISLPSR